MRQINVSRILHQQHHWRGNRLVSGLLKMRLHQGAKGNIWLAEQTIQGFYLFPVVVHLNWQRTQRVLSQLRCRFYRSSRDAAEAVFAEVGYDEANTNRIAAQAGISPGSLYHFFSNKEEIAHALAAHYTEGLQSMYSSIFSHETASLPLSVWLDQIIHALVKFHLAQLFPMVHGLFHFYSWR
jgi:hypothetical protein